MNISTKFQLHPPYGEFFFLLFHKFGVSVAMATNQSNSAFLTKFIWLIEYYSRNITVKLLSKYLQ